ncbi:MAG: hypothetical protein M3071_13700 [Actinomycetota bacterium]|nr:hypothetical protein [Actinomycetota bacterium]
MTCCDEGTPALIAALATGAKELVLPALGGLACGVEMPGLMMKQDGREPMT